MLLLTEVKCLVVSWLRDNRDYGSALQQLRTHPFLNKHRRSSDYFIVDCPDETLYSLINECLSYCPIIIPDQTIKIRVRSEHYCQQPGLFGYQCSDEINTYYPAYRNVTTFVFTLFHEYGHWLYSVSGFLGTDERRQYAEGLTCVSAAERFANDFAWFCLRPSYLILVNKRASQFFRFKLENHL